MVPVTEKSPMPGVGRPGTTRVGGAPAAGHRPRERVGRRARRRWRRRRGRGRRRRRGRWRGRRRGGGWRWRRGRRRRRRRRRRGGGGGGGGRRRRRRRRRRSGGVRRVVVDRERERRVRGAARGVGAEPGPAGDLRAGAVGGGVVPGGGLAADPGLDPDRGRVGAGHLAAQREARAVVDGRDGDRVADRSLGAIDDARGVQVGRAVRGRSGRRGGSCWCCSAERRSSW